ncbi:hypothetical protein ACP4OV_025023 [Aristida adscensionis]
MCRSGTHRHRLSKQAREHHTFTARITLDTSTRGAPDGFGLQAFVAALLSRAGGGRMDAAEAGKAGPSTSRAVAPLDRSSSRLGAAGAESFDGALKELKDLRSQLQEAADCCEKAFQSTEKKKLIMESTKSYICDAVVAVIDHLGTVSSKLEHRMQEKTDVTETERKLEFLKQVHRMSPSLLFSSWCQRLLTCQQYAISLKLLTVRGDTDAIQYHRRYLSQSVQRSNEENGASSSKDDPELLEITNPTVSGATRALKPYDDVQSSSGKENTVATTNIDESPRAAVRTPSSFRAEDIHIILGDDNKKKASHGSNILSFLKKTRRHS